MSTPLADRLRPETLDEVVGQAHLLGKDKVLRKIIESGEIPNLIFCGPSGIGKTTVANIIAKNSGRRLYRLNATTASTADIKDMVGEIGGIAAQNGILLYLDEIQYFNKKQQQTLLEHIEKGDITLIASTTENPYFYIYNAILSRSTVFEFKEIAAGDIIPALRRGVSFLEKEKNLTVLIENKTIERIASSCGGDVRRAINALELCVLTARNENGKLVVNHDSVDEVSGSGALKYDQKGDEHYDILSAYQKSMRGSDPNAAVHYLARLLEAGDLPSACRRLLVCASEDVGLAYPQIIPIVQAAVATAQMVGLPEAQLPLAAAVVLVATAPKSNSSSNAIWQASADIASGKSGPIPRQLQNKHFDGEDNHNKGQFYEYAHNHPNHYVDQQYLPDVLKDKVYYNWGDNKNEQAFKAYWDKIKGNEK